MRAFILVTLLATALAHHGQGWQAGQQLEFMFENELLTGIPAIQSQYAGLKLAAKVIVQSLEQDELRVKMVDAKFVNINDKLPYGSDGRPLLPRAEQSVPSQMRRWLETPFTAKLKQGLIELVRVEREEPVEVTNVKKALLSQIQISLDNHLNEQLNTEQLSNEQLRDEFSGKRLVLEETSLVGQCEVSYDIHRMSPRQIELFEQNLKHYSGDERSLRSEICQDQEYYEIVKTKNMDKCTKRPVMQVQVGFKVTCDPTVAHCKDTMTHVSSSRIVVCGRPWERFVIRQAETTNVMNIAPLAWNTKEKMISSAKLSLQLIKIKKSGSFESLPKPQNGREIKSLLFGYDNEERTGDSLLPRPQLEQAPAGFRQQEKKSQVMEEIVSKLRMVANEIFNSPESCSSRMDVAGHISIIAKTLRMLDLEDLITIEKRIIDNQQTETLGKLWTDILAMVGTNPSIMLIKRHVEHNTLNKYNTLTLVQKTIRNARFPTEEILKQLFDMVKHLEQDGQMQQHKSIGNYNAGLQQLTPLVYDACVEPASSRFPVHVYGRFCDKDAQIVDEISQYLRQKIQQTPEGSERLVFITALGKLGHPSVLQPLLSVIESRNVEKDTPIARSIAVYALKRVARLEPTLIRPVLIKLIENVAEVPEVRMAAIALLPFTQPASADLQRLAIRSWYEPSKQINAFITTTLNSLAQTEVPELKNVGLKAQNVLYLVKPVVSGMEFSHNIHASKFVHFLKLASIQSAKMVRSPQHYVPSEIAYSYDFFGGSWHVEGLSFNIYTKGMDNLMEGALNFVNQDNGLISEQVKQQLEKIRQVLNIEKRGQTESRPEVLMMIKSLGFENAYALDSDVVAQLLQVASQKAGEMSQDLFSQGGRQLTLTGASDMLSLELYGPTDSGFPLYFAHTVPMCYALKGSVALNSLYKTPNNPAAVINSQVEVVSELRPVWNSKIEANLGLFSPFTKEYIGTGVEVSFHASLPLDQKLQINAQNGQIALALNIPRNLRGHDDVELFHFFVKPYTLIKDFYKGISPVTKQAQIKIIRANSTPKTQYIANAGSVLGIRAQYNLTSDLVAFDQSLALEKLRQLDFQSFLATLPLVSSIKQFSSQLLIDPSRSQTKEIRTVFTIGYGKRAQASSSSEYPSHRPIYGEQSVYYPHGPKDWSVQKELGLICEQYHTSYQQQQQCLEQALNRIQNTINEAEALCQSLDNGEFEWQSKFCKDTTSICGQAEHICKQQFDSYKCEQQKQACLSRRQTLERIHKRALKHNVDIIGGVGINTELIDDSNTGSVWSILNRNKINNRRQILDLHLSFGSKIEQDLKTRLHMSIKTEKQRDAFELDLDTDIKFPTLHNRWDIEKILYERPEAHLVTEIKFGAQQSRKQSVRFLAKLSKTQKQIEGVKRSPEYKRCQEEQRYNKLASVCEQVRHEASSLNEIRFGLEMPEHFKQCPITARLSSALKYYLMFNGELVESEQSVGPNELVLDFDRTSSMLDVYFGTKKVKNVIKPYFVPNVLPLSTRNSLWQLMGVQRPTRNMWPASCRVSKNVISTFDNFTYSVPQSISGCGEKLLFKDCSLTRPIAVTLKHQQNGANVLKVIAGQHVVEIGKQQYNQQLSIKVDGQEHDSTFKNGQLQLIRYKDNVVSVRHLAHQLEVYFDGQNVELVAPFFSLYNKACGLCGDLNLESTADLETPERCVIADTRIAALSYLLDRQQCGINGQYTQILRQETQKCARKRIVPTKNLLKDTKQMRNRVMGQTHSLDMKRRSLCISKRPLNTCQKQNVKQGRKVQVEYTCFTYPSIMATQMRERAQFGDIIDEIANLPTHFTKTEFEPVLCDRFGAQPNIEQIGY